jgi:putative membrane protein
MNAPSPSSAGQSLAPINLMSRARASLPLTRPYFWLVIAWVLGMIAVPIARWTWGDAIIPTAATLTSLLQCAAVLAILIQSWGVRRALLTLAVAAALTWLAEALGSKTGIPFGRYRYTDLLQPQILGVPALIPIAWFMMLGPSWAVAHVLLGDRASGWRLAAVSALAITAWDLFLDPQMVGWGFWIWDDPLAYGLPISYFGIPWVNYAGWLLTAFVVTLAIRPAKPLIGPLLVIYGIVWALQSIGLAVFWGQPGPALVGCIVMGAIWLAALRAHRAQGAQ